ncbi:leucine-rich repeat protein [[Clostridium] hylemonae]|uniref:leucine-rich repeat protein n=1 Tax=[Clostridium] hylemonae TaxID=89153 RepID=UPI001D096408|nr:leucine-rich repeat protein [[Clostridium] hylemonae]MCB7522365.1 leucine-rich repeat protein [[Clostridium] hylemonae]
MKKTKKSILALLLAVMMLFLLAPAPVFATGADDAPTGSSTQTETSEGAPSDVGSGAPDIITSEQQKGEAQTGAQFDQSGTVDLNRYDSFEEAASAQISEPHTQYTTLKITGKTNGDTWTTDDGNYFRTNFSRVTELDLGNFTGTFGESAFEKSSIEKVCLPTDVAIPIYMFSGCESLATLSVGSNLPASGVIDLTGFTAVYSDRAFEDCTSIKEVKLPADVPIANAMFSGCKSLATLSVAGNINAQGGVIDLTGFTAIYSGTRTFMDCTSIKEVKLPADVPILDYMFSGCESLATLSVGSNSSTPNVIDLTGFTAACGINAFEGCTSIKEVKLPADVAIPTAMFFRCEKLATLSVAGNINAQGGVIDLTGFTAAYGYNAFAGCTSIKEVKLPADVAIADGMFTVCKNLATLSVAGNINAQEGVIDLTGFTAAYGWNAFAGCTSIKEARLPDSAISQEVFSGCINLDVLMFYGAGAPSVGDFAFSGVSDGGTLYYPQGGMDYTKGTFGAPGLANWDFIEAFGPEIVAQPSAQTGTVGQTAAFQFAVSGVPLAFRWQQSVNNGRWTDLADGGGYAGTATDMLIIDNLQQEQNGYKFRCMASNYGNYSADVISNAVTLTVNAEPALQPPAAPYDKAAPGDLVFTYTGAIAGPDVGVSAQFTYLPTGEVSTNLPPESRTGAGDGFVYTPDVGVTFPLALMQQHASPNGSGVAGLRTGRYRLDLTVMLADDVSKVYSAEFEIIDSTTVPVPKPGSTIPQTGDTANPLFWLLIILAALAVCASLLLYRKRRAKDSKATGIPRKR